MSNKLKEVGIETLEILLHLTGVDVSFQPFHSVQVFLHRLIDE
jgi:hypothetical protein